MLERGHIQNNHSKTIINKISSSAEYQGQIFHTTDENRKLFGTDPNYFSDLFSNKKISSSIDVYQNFAYSTCTISSWDYSLFDKIGIHSYSTSYYYGYKVTAANIFWVVFLCDSNNF